MNLKCVIGMHEWNGCECSTCGKTRDEGHDWGRNCEKCASCGTVRSGAHDWSKNCEKCARCAKTRVGAHDWNENSGKCTGCGKLLADTLQVLIGILNDSTSRVT